MTDYQDLINRHTAAMSKPAPQEALALIASGRVVIEVNTKTGHVLLDSVDGKQQHDPEFPDRKMGLAGAWPLFHAGMIDQFGIVTPAGHALLTALSRQGGGWWASLTNLRLLSAISFSEGYFLSPWPGSAFKHGGLSPSGSTGTRTPPLP